MKYNNLVETIGSITKCELLYRIKKDAIENTLVLANFNPFATYRSSSLPIQKKYNFFSLYIIFRYRYAPEKISRIIKELVTNHLVHYYPSFGEIEAHGFVYPCLRIKDKDQYPVIRDIQKFLKLNDFSLMPYRKIHEKSQIKIFKSFQLLDLKEGLYRDLSDNENFYFRISSPLTWKSFEKCTHQVKESLRYALFDAAIGIIYRISGIENVIRILDKDKSLKRVMQINDTYLNEIEHRLLVVSMHDTH